MNKTQNNKASKMAYWETRLPTRSDDLSWVSGTKMVEGENVLHQTLLGLLYVLKNILVCAHANPHKINKFNKESIFKNSNILSLK